MKKYFSIIFLSFCLILVSYFYGSKNGRKDIGLAEFHFSVVDAETGENFGKDFRYTFPGTDFASIVSTGPEFSVWYTVSDKPVTLRIGKEGYQDQEVEIPLLKNQVGAGPLPQDLHLVKLKRERSL